MSVNNINYDKMDSNPICLNIPWYEDKDRLKKWEQGETGYPWVDTIMKQLKNEGWIHYVCRLATSTFLTRRDLWLSWEDGLKVAVYCVIWCLTSTCWMLIGRCVLETGCGCLAPPSRRFSSVPVRYGRKMDPDGVYIRRYLPILKNMPICYLFEPWKAPKAVQEKAGCVIGVDYPKPMVDHAKASKDCYNM
ncbi:CRY1-like protein, partial [Mya arenaria]